MKKSCRRRSDFCEILQKISSCSNYKIKYNCHETSTCIMQFTEFSNNIENTKILSIYKFASYIKQNLKTYSYSKWWPGRSNFYVDLLVFEIIEIFTIKLFRLFRFSKKFITRFGIPEAYYCVKNKCMTRNIWAVQKCINFPFFSLILV